MYAIAHTDNDRDQELTAANPADSPQGKPGQARRGRRPRSRPLPDMFEDEEADATVDPVDAPVATDATPDLAAEMAAASVAARAATKAMHAARTAGSEQEAKATGQEANDYVSGLTPPSNLEESENPKTLGFSDQLLSALQDIDVPDTATIKPTDYLSTYTQVYEQAATFDELLSRCDMARGESAWIKGKILNLFKPITAGQKGLIEHGVWNQFLKGHGISPDTSENVRHIADRFSRLNARRLGYTNMVCTYWAEKRVEKQSKLRPAKPVKPAVGESQADDVENGAAKEQDRQPRTLRLADISPKLNRVMESLTFIGDEMPNAADLYKNPEQSKQILDSLPVLIDGLRNLANRIEQHVIPEVRAMVQKYVDEGQEACIGQPTANEEEED